MTDIPPGWVALAVAVIAAFGTGGYFAQRGKNKIDLLDQYQEDRASDRDRMDILEKRVDAGVRRERIRDDYILELRQHISEGKPPPPPPFPVALTKAAEETA